MGESLTEWLALGLLLQQLRPDRFEEVVSVLRETVGLQQFLSPNDWTFSGSEQDAPKA